MQNALIPSVSNTSVAVPSLGTVRAGYFWGLDRLIQDLGGDPVAILERQGLARSVFDDPDNAIECMAAVNLLEYCSSALSDPLFGLHLATYQEPEVFGCVVALAQAAPTLRHALQCLVDFVPVSASPECELEIVTSRSVAELRWRTNIGFGDEVQTNYHGVLIVMKTLQKLRQQRFQPNYATLTCRVDRADIEPLNAHLGCKVRGKSANNAIAFSADLLDRPLASSNRLLFNILGHGLAQLRLSSKGDFVEQVGACVRRELSSGHCNVDGCAGALGTSTRTLQKRLNRVGVKFSDIVLDERIKLAKHALLWSDFSLDEIAFQLGYSEQTSFGRAFKKVTGLTPKEFRLTQKLGH